MKEWVSSLEEVLDQRLQKWKKESWIENGEAVQIEWQFTQTHIMVNIFWENGKEAVHLQYDSPRSSLRYEWDGLNNRTFNRVIDRIGNWAQVTMYPPKDYMD